MRFLAPIRPLPENEVVYRGSELFPQIGCSARHVPELLTGPSEIAALDHKSMAAYSDFLLDDVGTGDGVEQGTAKGNKFWTSPLWGLASGGIAPVARWSMEGCLSSRCQIVIRAA